jgi:hypothetical protein
VTPSAPHAEVDVLPAAGGFGGLTLASARAIDPAQWAGDDPIQGLVREAGYVWGSVRDEDGELYSVMRRIPPRPDAGPATAGEHVGLGGRLIVLATRGPAGERHDDLRLRREAKNAASSEELVRQGRPDGVRFSAPAGERRALELELGVDDVAYREEGVLDVRGHRACPALQWYLPGPAEAMLYLTQTWEVDGELLGRPVRGFLFWEEAYMYPGARLYVEKDALVAAGYRSWYSAATRYRDGTTEVAHFVFGSGALGMGVVASSTGEVLSTNRLTGSARLTADRAWHVGIDYDFDGTAWRCEPDPRGRMQLGPMPNPQQEGRIFRRGDDRVPEVHMAFGEVVPARIGPG